MTVQWHFSLQCGRLQSSVTAAFPLLKMQWASIPTVEHWVSPCSKRGAQGLGSPSKTVSSCYISTRSRDGSLKVLSPPGSSSFPILLVRVNPQCPDCCTFPWPWACSLVPSQSTGTATGRCQHWPLSSPILVPTYWVLRKYLLNDIQKMLFAIANSPGLSDFFPPSSPFLILLSIL